MNLVEQYLSDIGAIRATHAGTGETSYYPALSNLLNEIGQSLSPKVRCVMQLQNKGAGMPDGGLFTADQLRVKALKEQADKNPLSIVSPSRGVIEIKAPDYDLQKLAGSDQIRRYWEQYRLVLITNYRAFALIGCAPDGKPAMLESFELASSEQAFWNLVAHPRSFPKELGERCEEYLRRVMLHNAPLSSPQEVAALLASYARDAKARIESAELPALSGLRSGLEDALGLQFTGDKGEHFFRSTLIQTLFYGIFSAWVLWTRKGRAAAADSPSQKNAFSMALKESSSGYQTASDRFDWCSAVWHLRVPMIRALFGQIATPERLGPLGLKEVLDWTGAALNRVDADAFFAAFDEGHAVQYFYEPFLQAFDPELRKELGVWYTPSEIVDYQVERVDTVLREELDIPDGLADPRVIVLDPCCGTGAYVRSVLDRIAKTLKEKHGDGLIAQDLKTAATSRVYGFEILPAPFVIAHLQIGLLLENLGAPLSESSDERAGIYLTNALTGWEPPKEKPKQLILMPELEQERDAANLVKQQKKILVVLGNPPYNGFAGVSPEEENDLVKPYKGGLVSEWGIKKFNLDDLYIRFFRLAEKRIAEHSGIGVVSFISNFSYLQDASYVVMRQRFLKEFDRLWFDSLNGDSRETGKKTPDGNPDPSVFSTDWNREGIRVGTAIALLVKKGAKRGATRPEEEKLVRFRQFWGTHKREDLLASLASDNLNASYEQTTPTQDNRYSFCSSTVSTAYLSWPKIVDLCEVPPFNGPVERRGNSLIVYPDQRDRLCLLKKYLDRNVSDEEMSTLVPEFMKSSGEFKAEKARKLLFEKASFDKNRIVRYPFKPYDMRLAYLDADIQPLFSRPSPQLIAQAFPSNAFFVTRDTADKDPEGPPFLFSPVICDYDCISGHARHFPLLLKRDAKKNKSEEKKEKGVDAKIYQQGDLLAEDMTTANLSASARSYLQALKLPDPDTDTPTAELIWYHALAIGYSPAYLSENSDGIRQDWPRIPLPATKEALLASAELGRSIAALLDSEMQVPGVTCGKIRDDLKAIALCQRVDNKQINPDAGDLELTAGWGHAGKEGVTMPGRGRVEVSSGSTGCIDVYLNSDVCWKNIPQATWEMTIGGYQVLKKWLSYREKSLLSRSLTLAEARYFSETARRLTALIALYPSLDENYRSVVK